MLSRFSYVQLALIVGALLLSPVSNAGNHASVSQSTDAARKQKMERFINDLLKRMTLEEKIGQMNQVGGTFANTGPINPLSDQGKEMREGKIGSVLNLASVDGIRKIQKVAVEETRLHIPLIFGLDVIHGMKTIFPIPLGEAASWDLRLLNARLALRPSKPLPWA